MSEGPTAALDRTWQALEEAIHGFGQQARDLSEGASERARFEAYRGVLALLSENYLNQVYSDRRRPEFMPYLGAEYHYAGPAPDFAYALTHIEPGVCYRVWGKRGDAKRLDVQHMASWFGQSDDPKARRTLGNHTFESQGISCDEDGRFEFFMSADKPPSGLGWWKLEQGVSTLLFRETFTDYAAQGEASSFHFEPLLRALPRAEGSLDGDYTHRLQSLTRAMKQYAFTFNIAKSFAGLGDNAFRIENFGGDAGMAGQSYIQARYQVPEGSALIGEWRVPEECEYWSLCLYSDLYLAPNFMVRQVNLNDVMARVSGDGLLRFVISDFDPSIDNWLDADGRQTGIVLLRTRDASSVEVPSLRIVSASELPAAYGDDSGRITAERRVAALKARREHFSRRLRR